MNCWQPAKTSVPVGLLVILFSGTMILPGLVALIYRDGAGRAFTQTFFVALAIGS
ncbi:hypothetical protein MJI47_30545, partial [Salmonella enterica subsp. enterica serovar Kentucky]|nr:hypothetical protein [Salmonella enterica subsp. enterica serovar Kentucky]